MKQGPLVVGVLGVAENVDGVSHAVRGQRLAMGRQKVASQQLNLQPLQPEWQ